MEVFFFSGYEADSLVGGDDATVSCSNTLLLAFKLAR